MSKGDKNIYHSYTKWEVISKILECISENKDDTIPSISKTTGFSYTAVKNVIDDLINFGILKEKNSFESRKRGRPPQTYSIIHPLEIIYPNKQYDFLLERMVYTLIKNSSDGEFNTLMKNIGDDMAQITFNKWDDQKIKFSKINDFIIAMSKELKENGIPNDIKHNGNEININIHNCIFEKISKKFNPNICLIHKHYFSFLLEKTLNMNSEIEHVQSLAKRESFCSHIIKIKS